MNCWNADFFLFMLSEKGGILVVINDVIFSVMSVPNNAISSILDCVNKNQASRLRKVRNK